MIGTPKFGPRYAKTCPGIGGQRMLRSACTSAQSDQGLRCPQTESLDTIEWQFQANARVRLTHVQDYLNPHILRILEGTFFA